MLSKVVALAALVAVAHANNCADLSEADCFSDDCVMQGYGSDYKCVPSGCNNVGWGEEAKCAAKGCEYDEMAGCTAKKGNKQCDDPTFTWNNCPKECAVDWENNLCRAKTCSDVYAMTTEAEVRPDCMAVSSSCQVTEISETYGGGEKFTQFYCHDGTGPECGMLSSKETCDMWPKCEGTDGDSFICFNKAEGRSCSMYFDETECNKADKCEYVSQLNFCADKGFQLDCGMIGDCTTCAENEGCFYKDYFCQEATGGEVSDTCETFNDEPATSPGGGGGGGGSSCEDCATCSYENCYDKCSWEESMDGGDGFCRERNCREIWEEAPCQEKGCQFTPSDYGGDCAPKPSGKPCSEQSAAECDVTCHIDYSGATQSCVDKVCGHIMDKSQCEASSLGCEYYDVSSYNGICHTKGQPIPCQAINDAAYDDERKTPCEEASNCEYLSELKFCQEKGQSVKCIAYQLDQAKCVQSNCAYSFQHADYCYDPSEATCDQFYGVDECNAIENCVWGSSTGGMTQFCRECNGAQDCTYVEPTTPPPPPPATLPPGQSCSDLSVADCVAPCMSDGNICRDMVCSEYMENQCPTDKCTKIEYYCTPKDNNEPCDTLEVDQCPYPRCEREYSADGETKCRTATCADYYSEDICKAGKAADGSACKYDPGCEDPNDFTCNLQSLCYSGTNPDCTRMGNEQCAQYSDYCDVIDDSYCVAKGDKPSCDTYMYDEDACKAQSECEFYDKNSIQFCYDKAEGITCSAIWDSSVCSSEPSCYTTSNMACKKCASSPCEDEDRTTAAPNLPPNGCSAETAADCSFYDTCTYDDNGCRDKECFEIYVEGACAAPQCQWEQGIYGDRCNKPDDGNPCNSYASSTDCDSAPTRCTWSYATMEGSCVDLTCDSIYEPTRCNSASTVSCEWQEAGLYCNGKGEAPKCSFILDDQTQCQATDGCEFTNGFCTNAGEDLPCSHPSYQENCPSDRCKSANYQCVDKDYVFQCNEFYDWNSCEQQNGCQYDVGTSMCSDCPSAGCQVTAKDCSTYSEADCPMAYCQSFTGTCKESSCDMRYDEKSCTYKANDEGGECEWDLSGMCKNKGVVLECGAYYDEQYCTLRSDCNWVGGSTYRCHNKNEPLECSAYSEEDCPTTRCKFEDFMCMDTAGPTQPSTTLPPSPPPAGDYNCKDENVVSHCWNSRCKDDGTCERCKDSFYLLDGACVESCPITHVPIGAKASGRFCSAGAEYIGDVCDTDKLGPCVQCSVTRDSTKCVECPADRFLFFRNGYMRCNPELTCLASKKKFEELGDDGPDCNCFDGLALDGGKNNRDCQRCRYTKGIMDNKEANTAGTKICLRCRNAGLLLWKDARTYCIRPEGTCPAGLVASGAGDFGRRCQPAHDCIANLNVEHAKNKADPSKNSASYCKCGAGIANCRFDENGLTALMCKARRYLHNGACVLECPTGFTPKGKKATGRTCV